MMLMMLTTIFLVGDNTSAYTTVNSEGLELELMQAMLEIYVKCERNSVNITVNQLNGKDDCSASYIVQWLHTNCTCVGVVDLPNQTSLCCGG